MCTTIVFLEEAIFGYVVYIHTLYGDHKLDRAWDIYYCHSLSVIQIMRFIAI